MRRSDGRQVLVAKDFVVSQGKFLVKADSLIA